MSDNWPFIKQKFKICIVASKYNDGSSEYQVALLLSVVGSRAQKIYNYFTNLSTEDKSNYKKMG